MESIYLWKEKLLKESDIDKGKSYYEKLSALCRKKDLPEDIFDIIEAEKCCKLIR